MAYTGFASLTKKLDKEPGVKDAKAVAAFIGRKKYGKKRFQSAAAKGMKMKGMPPE